MNKRIKIKITNEIERNKITNFLELSKNEYLKRKANIINEIAP